MGAVHKQLGEIHGRLYEGGSSTTGYPKAEAVDDIGISSVTVAELEYGASKSRHPTKNRLALDQFISPLDVAAFDRDAATAYGRLRANLEQKGTPIGAMDLLIAAHALSLRVRLITNNAREFRRVPGLRIENWV
ncbi:MAG: type II toxin-antitoxin system VapC family toxin [Nitrospirota bacterium]